MRTVVTMLIAGLIFALAPRAHAEEASPQLVAAEEAQVVARSYLSLLGAEAFDRLCNDSGVIKGTSSNPPTVNFLGNQKMLAERMSKIWLAQNPQAKKADADKYLASIRKEINKNADVKLPQYGCDSKEVLISARALQLYASIPPEQLSTLLAGEVKKQLEPMPAAPAQPEQTK